MNKYLFFLTLVFLISCEEENNGSQANEVDQEVVDMIHIPDPKSADTSRIAKIKFEHLVFNFDTVSSGSIVTSRYSFTNNGQVDLYIHSVKSTCGCTATEWPKDPIEPGDSSTILVTFDTKDRLNYQNKPIFVLTNAIPNQTKLELNGYVIKK